MKEKLLDKLIEIFAILSVFLLVYILNKSNYVPTSDLATSDVFYEYSSAVNISNGINPYDKILGGSLLYNNKYATLFPLYYYFLLVVAFFSKFSFVTFVDVYRIVLFVAECSAFIFTYLKFKKINKPLLGFTAAAFLILNRWAINNVADLKQDMVAIAFLMASLYYFDTKARISYFLYGMSLGIKHIGIFFSPLYLLPLIYKEINLKQFFLNISLIATPIIVPSISFIFTNAKSFFMSLVFSFTRAPASSGGNPLYGYEKLLVLYALYGPGKKFSLIYALVPRLPLLCFSLLNMFLLFTKRIPRYVFALLSIILFITFNPVYFDQYFLWLAPFVLYFLTDYYNNRQPV